MERKKLSSVFLMILFSSALLFSGCQSKQTRNQHPETGFYYTCPMHHQIHKDKPGYCPICGMKLIKVSLSSDEEQTPLDSALSYLTEPVTQTVVGSFKVIEPVTAAPEDTVTADGYIGFDERDVNRVNTRITGRIEKLYIRYANQHIRKGQPLMVIYSPQLVSAERNLLQAVQDKDQTLIDGLKEQLLNLGMQPSEIQKIIQRGNPLVDITIYSPYDGISKQTSEGQGMVTSQNNGSGNMNSSASVAAGQAGMSSSSNPALSNEPELLNIRQGMYVNMGQTVFNIQNISRIWAILNVFTRNLWHIQQGDAVNLFADANPSNLVSRRVNFVPPYRTGDEKTTRVRVYMNHLPADWKIGTLIHGKIMIQEQGQGMYVPLSAVNRLGLHHDVVWVQDQDHTNVFHVRNVEAGIQTADSIQILAGIQPGEKIVENAAYMVGSDSFIGR